MSTTLSLLILTPDELAHSRLLVPLVQLINDAYARVGGVDAEAAIPRYEQPEEFVEDFGVDGLCAIVIDASKNDLPVAIVGAKRWKGSRDETLGGDDGRDWEIGPAASLGDAQYRKKGLVDRCLQELYMRLLGRVHPNPLRLWMKVVEDVNAPYWLRKGYRQVGERWFIPKGEWRTDRAFAVIDMLKEITQEDTAAVQAEFDRR